MLRILLLPLLLGFNQLKAQSNPDPARFPYPLDEIQLTAPKEAPGSLFGITDPPSVPVRAMGEWEELQALLISWQGSSSWLQILTEIVRAAQKECRVIICCNTSFTENSARNFLTSRNVDIANNVEFLVVPNNSIWIRDYGPNCVYANGTDSLYFVDWRYNRTTRPQDDTLANKVAQYLSVPLYTTTTAPNDLVHTGGNFMSDGLGTAFSSRLILSENQPGNPYGASAKTEAEIDAIMYDYMGIHQFIKMDKLPYDVIHHIDMHMKLLDEETLLVGKYPDGIADGPQIEANLQYVLSNFKSAFGTPYKVIRIPMPPKFGYYPNNGADYRTFSNAVFVNKTVLVPFYELQYDTTAQRIWEEALPGYNIVGIDCNAIIGSLGAIHCITKEIGVSDPLHIVHQELPCMDNAQYLQYPVWANLEHRSGVASARIYFTTDLNSTWESVDLPFYPMDDTLWSHRGFIPKQPAGSTVYYYIEATSGSGKTITRPLTAPAGYWQFCVTESVSTTETVQAELAPIYPNPTAAMTVIPVTSSDGLEGSIRLFNAIGQLQQTVYRGEIPAGTTNYFLDASRFPSGAYWVELRTEKETLVQQLVIR
ncbi:MAG: T9SS type A sorting domain-containing protein [Bacteroidetes bacterium]|nr:MAG: T9SS type A sorting domain-containing protein [Bacteroidota bacterium]